MSANKEVRRERCRDALDLLMSNGYCVFFTLTTVEVVDIHEIRQMWRKFRDWLLKQFPKGVKYVMNYELHPNGHGWHIHSVFNSFLPYRLISPELKRLGFGRVDLQVVGRKGVADYLTKHALKAYRGFSKGDKPVQRLRLVNASRGLPRLSDYSYYSDLQEYRKRFIKFAISSKLPFPFPMIARLSDIAVNLGCRSSLDFFGFVKSYIDNPSEIVNYARSFRVIQSDFHFF